MVSTPETRQPGQETGPEEKIEIAEEREIEEGDKESAEPTVAPEEARRHVLAAERKKLATEYEVLRDELLKLKEESMTSESSRKKYEDVRRQYIKNVVEHIARYPENLDLLKEINEQAKRLPPIEREDSAREAHEELVANRFDRTLDASINIVAGMPQFTSQFEMLLQHRPEGEEMLSFLTKKMPGHLRDAFKGKLQRDEVLDPKSATAKFFKKLEAGEIYVKQGKAEPPEKPSVDKKVELKEGLQEFFDDVKVMVRKTETRKKNRDIKGGADGKKNPPKRKGLLKRLFGGE